MVPGVWRIHPPTTGIMGDWTWSIRVATRVASMGPMLFEPIIAARDSRFENPDQPRRRGDCRRADSIGWPHRRWPIAPDAGTVYRVQGRDRRQAGTMGQNRRVHEDGRCRIRPGPVSRPWQDQPKQFTDRT